MRCSHNGCSRRRRKRGERKAPEERAKCGQMEFGGEGLRREYGRGGGGSVCGWGRRSVEGEIEDVERGENGGKSMRP